MSSQRLWIPPFARCDDAGRLVPRTNALLRRRARCHHHHLAPCLCCHYGDLILALPQFPFSFCHWALIASLLHSHGHAFGYKLAQTFSIWSIWVIYSPVAFTCQRRRGRHDASLGVWVTYFFSQNRLTSLPGWLLMVSRPDGKFRTGGECKWLARQSRRSSQGNY